MLYNRNYLGNLRDKLNIMQKKVSAGTLTSCTYLSSTKKLKPQITGILSHKVIFVKRDRFFCGALIQIF